MSAALVANRVGQVVEGVLIALLVLLMIGCEVGPDYKRPAVNVPGSYRQALAPDIAPASQAPSIADQQWTSVFQDAALQTPDSGRARQQSRSLHRSATCA
jgi:multidrug efflux system outer membrane protein